MPSGSVLAFGFGGFGGMATGELKNEPLPVEISQLNALNVQQISVGLWHTLIVTDTGSLYSVGRGRYGALGLGDDADIILTSPILIPTFKDTMRVMNACAG